MWRITLKAKVHVFSKQNANGSWEVTMSENPNVNIPKEGQPGCVDIV